MGTVAIRKLLYSPPARLSCAVLIKNRARVLHEPDSHLQGFDAFGAPEEVLFELFSRQPPQFAQKVSFDREFTDRFCVVHG